MAGPCVPSRLATIVALAVQLAATPQAVAADKTLCEPVAPGEAVVASCRDWAGQAVGRLVDDFTVDHLFKPALPPFERTWPRVLRPFTSDSLQETAALRALLRTLEPLRFTQLDGSTGTVASDLSAAPRELEVEAAAFGPVARLRLLLPEVLEGGYRRGPDLVEIAFWEKNRLAIEVSVEGRKVAGGPVRCLALTPDGLLVRFAGGAGAPVLVSIRECAP